MSKVWKVILAVASILVGVGVALAVSVHKENKELDNFLNSLWEPIDIAWDVWYNIVIK